VTLLLALALAATSPVARQGPSPEELVAAINAAPDISGGLEPGSEQIKTIRCRPFDEEPTEFRCRFKMRTGEGRQQRHIAVLALDAKGWTLLSLD